MKGDEKREEVNGDGSNMCIRSSDGESVLIGMNSWSGRRLAVPVGR